MLIGKKLKIWEINRWCSKEECYLKNTKENEVYSFTLKYWLKISRVLYFMSSLKLPKQNTCRKKDKKEMLTIVICLSMVEPPANTHRHK